MIVRHREPERERCGTVRLGHLRRREEDELRIGAVYVHVRPGRLRPAEGQEITVVILAVGPIEAYRRPLIHGLVAAGVRSRWRIVPPLPRVGDRHRRRRRVHHHGRRTRSARKRENDGFAAIGDRVGRGHEIDRGAPRTPAQRHLARERRVVLVRRRGAGHGVAHRHVPVAGLPLHGHRELGGVALGDRAGGGSGESHRKRVGRLPEFGTFRHGLRRREPGQDEHGDDQCGDSRSGARGGASDVTGLGGRRLGQGSGCHGMCPRGGA